LFYWEDRCLLPFSLDHSWVTHYFSP
jgi:hypothetical protein